MTTATDTISGHHAPRLFHPLSGSNLATLVDVLSSNGPLPFRHWPQAAIAVAATLARWPFYTAEKLRFARMRARTEAMPAPVFIVGHWRSGTTHLYNVLSRDPQWGYVPPLATGMPWDLLGIVTALRPLLEQALPAHRFIDNVPVTPESPQEDEIALANMLPLSFYHGIYFPSRLQAHFNRGVFFDGCSAAEVEAWKRTFVYFLEKVALQQGGKRLLIKNPVYTGRIAMLRAIWPDAKFVHIHRNPYQVFESSKNFYEKLFQELALQDYGAAPVEQLILDAYPRLMDRMIGDSAALPADAFIEIRYETFEADPLGETARIYDTLGIEGYDEARPAFESYLDSVRSYRKNSYRYSEAAARSVESRWKPFLDRWGYKSPGATAG
ncbi:MAG: sulfotransferase family protein [Rhodospirillaceae bacterium]|nr:sulfotransferase family protein [Rhodospirillaceae bacterium]